MQASPTPYFKGPMIDSLGQHRALEALMAFLGDCVRGDNEPRPRRCNLPIHPRELVGTSPHQD